MRLTTPAAIILDASPLSLLAQRPGHVEGTLCRDWYQRLADIGCIFFIPEIAEYEIRRELLRLRNADAIQRLDDLRNGTAEFLPLTTPAILLAAQLWAEARQVGRPTAGAEALDADALITAQARVLIPAAYGLSSAVIATLNVGHMAALANVGPTPPVPAELWSDIQP